MCKKIICVLSIIAVLGGATLFTTRTNGLGALSSSAIGSTECSVESQSAGQSRYEESVGAITNLTDQITKNQKNAKEQVEKKKEVNKEIKQIKKDIKTSKSELKKMGKSTEKEAQTLKAKIEELETRLKNKNEVLKQIASTNKEVTKNLRDFQAKLKEHKEYKKNYEACKQSLAVVPETSEDLPPANQETGGDLPPYVPETGGDLPPTTDTQSNTAPVPVENIYPKTSEIATVEGFIDGDKERQKAGKLVVDLEKFGNGRLGGIRTYNLSEEQKSDFLKKRDQLYKELTDTHDKLAIIEKTFENLFAQIFQQEGQLDNLKSQLNSSEQNKKSAEKAGKKPSQQLLQRIKEIEKNIKKQKDILNTSNAQLNQETQKINKLGYKNHRDVGTHKSMIKGGLDMLDNKIIWDDLLK